LNIQNAKSEAKLLNIQNGKSEAKILNIQNGKSEAKLCSGHRSKFLENFIIVLCRGNFMHCHCVLFLFVISHLSVPVRFFGRKMLRVFVLVRRLMSMSMLMWECISRFVLMGNTEELCL